MYVECYSFEFAITKGPSIGLPMYLEVYDSTIVIGIYSNVILSSRTNIKPDRHNLGR